MTYRSFSCVLIALVLVAEPAFAWQNWYRYENDRFIVYSEASRRTTRNLVKHLERFEAAVLQFANVRIPGDAPKVRLVILSSHAEFQGIIGSQWLGGASFRADDVPHIIVSSGSKSLRTEIIARHQYAHVLLDYSTFPYPPWFREGFAELMDMTTFRNRNRTYTVGEWGRQFWDRSMRPWEEILDPGFQVHAIDFVGDRNDARLQCWLLVYYFLLDDNFGNTDKLKQYLALVASGQDPVPAMEMALGEPITQWSKKLNRKHSIEAPRYYTFDFREPVSYSELSERMPVPASEVDPILEHIRDTRRHY